MRDEKGAILLTSLWILTILTVLAVGFAYRMSVELKLTGFQIAKLKAFYLAKAGVVRAVATLECDKATDFQALNQSWSNNPENFDRIPLGEGTFTVGYSPAGSDSGRIFYGAADEERKININYATREMLESLPGISPDIAASIVDWRDKDDVPDPEGAEDSYYQSLPNPYHSKNANFESIEELLWVKGITPSVLARVHGWITAYGDGRININTCQKEILLALGLDEHLSDKIIGFRRGRDDRDGTEDDNVFPNAETIVETLRQSLSLTDDEMAQLRTLLARNLLCVKSHCFRIDSIGYLKDERVVEKVSAVVRVEKDQFPRIVYWHEG